MSEEYIIPACAGIKIDVKQGQNITVVDMEGGQVVDFFAEVTNSQNEFLSTGVTIDCNESLRGCKIFCVYGNETFQIRIRYVVVFVGFCSRIFCRIYLSGYSISCPLSFIHAF